MDHHRAQPASPAARRGPEDDGLRALGLSLLVSLGLLVPLLTIPLARAGAGGRHERAVELHARALELHEDGRREAARQLLERSCRLGHEPSCQGVWLRVDVEAREGPGARRDVERAARAVAAATDGRYFVHAVHGAVSARIYCPLARAQELERALARLRAARLAR